MTLFWNELHWYKFCAEASLFQSDYIPSDSPPTASPPCLALGLHQDGFFYLHESYCSTSILTRCHRALFMPRENRFCSFAFLLAWQPSCSFSSSSPLPFNYRPSVDVMPQDFSGLFSLPEKEHVQSSLDQSFAVTSQCLGQSMQEESTCGDKGQHPTTSKEHLWLYCAMRCPLVAPST